MHLMSLLSHGNYCFENNVDAICDILHMHTAV